MPRPQFHGDLKIGAGNMLGIRDVAQLVAHLLWEQGVGSSSLPIPTHLTWWDTISAIDLEGHVSAMYQTFGRRRRWR